MKTKIILLTGLLSMTTATMIAQAININKTNNNMAEEVQVIKAPVENVDRTPVVFNSRKMVSYWQVFSIIPVHGSKARNSRPSSWTVRCTV